MADGPSVVGSAIEETTREGGRLSIDDVEEGHVEGRMVRSFEIQGNQVCACLCCCVWWFVCV